MWDQGNRQGQPLGDLWLSPLRTTVTRSSPATIGRGTANIETLVAQSKQTPVHLVCSTDPLMIALDQFTQ